MWVRQLHIRGVKSFEDSGPIVFSKGINLLLAPNNSGKTTILRCIYDLQESEGHLFLQENARFDAKPQVDIILEEITSELKSFIGETAHNPSGQVVPLQMEPVATVNFDGPNVTIRNSLGTQKGFPRFKAQEGTKGEHPAWIYPFLANRKKAIFDPKISATNRRQVLEAPNHLYSKIDAVLTGGKSDFADACKEVLGIPIGCVQVDEGKIAGFVVEDRVIPIAKMGEGTRNVLQIIRDLIVAKNNLFLLEEPENDIHPRALKALLRLILHRADSNQFIISTHSNIVAKYLGARSDSKLFSISCDFGSGLPTSTVAAVNTDSPRDRLKVLEDLGYDVFDYDLWRGYLLLEESSAERIIRDILIPEFAPELKGALRTIACGGISKVEPKFEDFQRLFLFVHSAPAYGGRAWVYVDGDEAGKKTVESLRKSFSKSWPSEHFETWSQPNFEQYYPTSFREKAGLILHIEDKQKRRSAKENLLNQVIHWAIKHPQEAREAFRESASEIIATLRKIATTLQPQ